MSILEFALKDKNVLVTGATGFIGGRLAERLATEEEANVTGLGRDLAKAEHLRSLGVALQQVDLQDEARLRELVQGRDVVFHVAAWMARGNGQQEMLAHALNVTATERLVQFAAEAGVGRFVHVSSIGAYGLPQRPVVDEDHPLDTSRENDLYGRTKAQGELRARETAQRLGLELAIIRPALVYGPRSRSWSVQMLDLVQKGTPVLFGDGKGHAWPVYVDNLVDGMMLAAVRPEAAGEAFNFSDPVTDWRTFFGYYGKMCGRKLRQLPLWGARLLSWANNVFKLGLPINQKRLRFLTSRAVFPAAKAERLLGYRPRVDLAQGMAQTEAWFRQEGYLN